MRMRSLILVLALTFAATLAYAADTICVPAPGTTTTAPGAVTMTLAPEVEMFNRNFVSRYYGISESTVADLRQRHDWGTIYFMANLAARTGCPITEIASLAEQGVAWCDIASRYNVAMADLTMPVVPTARVAGYVAEVGVRPRMWISDRYGNVVLTEREDRRLKKMGYKWEDIAIAANISAMVGVPVYEVLQWTDRGWTWPQVAREYGLNEEKVLDTSSYPFARDSEVMIAPVGAGPTAQPCPPTQPAQPCPPTQPAQPVQPCPPGMPTTPPSTPSTPSTY